MHDACRKSNVKRSRLQESKRRGGRFSAVQGKVSHVEKKKMAITNQTSRAAVTSFAGRHLITGGKKTS